MAINTGSNGLHGVLAVDVGNTSTNFGLFAVGSTATDEPLGTCELTTPQRLTTDEARMQVEQVIAMLMRAVKGDVNVPAPFGVILSCVVPQLTGPWREALATACETRPFVVGPGLKTGLKMRYRDPAEIGPDRIADALGARELFGSPVVAVDFGTTVNIEAIDAEGTFLGGVIAPGIKLGSEALHEAAARLPIVELRAPQHVIGRSTSEAMQSGLVFGEVALVDGLVDKVFSELGGSAPIVLTGGAATTLAGLLSHETHVVETLTLQGLHQLYLLNS